MTANGTGEPQGIVCGAHNFAPGDLVVVVLPGGVLPGGFEISARKTYGHVRAGMICSSRELGTGDDHAGIIVLPADAGEPGDDAFAVLGLDEETIEFEINPDRAYALSLRGVAREAAFAYDAPFTDPADADRAGGRRRRSPRRRRRPGRLPGLRHPDGHRLRPHRADTGLAGPPGRPGGDAADLAGRRHHELRHARARAADPRLRPRPAGRADPRPPGDARGAADHPGRRATASSGPRTC